ncbi:GMP synthase-Glutamine amidotransferase [Octadecabacter temperatus]|uniref:GMP synthase n=1 Tax=Octadecabacter temperatus TaxID=1458307 RepID=A0A0K0Y580_9RHOB|nr:type 1 glutamine amidotransferase [Octadecabacter temperatus]AKS46143.1 GMP synthase [Octadecabacter temperatus]SIO08356.1 GMP synthase-Glutamine amidotransferase [Octadecabacter temperatus]
MKIGILRTGQTLPEINANHGEMDDLFVNLLADDDFTFQSYAVLNDDFPGTVTDCDAWLITGSASSAYENLPWIARLEDFIRTAKDAHVPMVGICFGHQIMAQALGGKVEKSDKGWGLGPHDYTFDGIDTPVTINAWHQDQVTALPDGAQTVGRSTFCEHAAISYGKVGYSVQAHPEFNNDFISELIELRRASVPADLVNAANSKLTQTSPSPDVVTQIKSFLKHQTLDIEP